jgi:cobalt-precorrin-5B (C1)-methyltransferase
MHSLLATTGVQSIGKLKWLESKGVKVIYRILNRDSSISLAYQQGATDDQLCFYEDGNTIDVDAEAILLKESGITGGFMEKVAEARRRGMRIIALKRPEINYQLSTVNGPHGLRRMVEKLLPDFFPMKTGLTTGACATAAVKAALLSLMGEESDEVTFALPDGETLSVPVRVERLGVASVVKDFSDDPDVTRGCTITAEVRFTDSTSIRFLQGEGVGVVTLPGLGLPVGEPAVNLTPRRMIETTIRQLTDRGCDIIISVAHGEEIAQKTFNSRVGVVGGISIIGTSGIVSPLSNEAFIESVRREMEVAQAIGCVEIALVSGKTSEDALCRESNIRCIHYGNFVGEALKAAAKLGFRHVVLAIMIGKAVKLAEGHLDTHSHKVTMNKEFIQRMLDEAHVAVDLSSITLARELWNAIPQNKLHDFVSTMIRHCEEHCSPLVPNSILTIRLIDDNGKIYEI